MTALPKVLTTVREIREWRQSIPHQEKLGFVPTMGALHEGHATLLRKARPECHHSVLSILVNPTQFGPNEDLSRYPRTFEYDLKIAAEEGVSVVFAPTPEQIYPEGFSTFIEENIVSRPLCGEFRPGHFRGVATIVLKLFNLIQPHSAYFGLKDAQQFFLLKKMVQDLNLDIQMEGVPTVREPDGLALSSRNAYLSPEERKTAPLLYRSLCEIRNRLTENGLNIRNKNGNRIGITTRSRAGYSMEDFLKQASNTLEKAGFQIQYLKCVSLPDFIQVKGTVLEANRAYLIAVAAYLEKLD